MAYSKFTIKDVKEKFKIQLIENDHLFITDSIHRVAISDYLKITLKEFLPLALAINTEKSRSEWIIAPIMAELRRQFNNEISLFSGSTFTVDTTQELDGKCDYIVSLSAEQFYIAAPIIAVVEAKKEDIIQGLGQCIATLYAAYIFNQREGNTVKNIYGAVTTGTTWRFIKLTDHKAHIDRDEYYLSDIELLMGILLSIIAREKADHHESP